LFAYKNVRIYKIDFQAISDSLAYTFEDSLIRFYHDPVLWTGVNQIEADYIDIKVSGPEIETMDLKNNSFMILEDTTGNYNQLKGKDMTAYFVNNEIDYLDVNGNSECIFFALDEVTNSMIGLNKIICSDMKIRFVKNKADNISFYTRPEADFIPPHEIEEEDRRLKGFNWRPEERPTLNSVLDSSYVKPSLDFLQKDDTQDANNDIEGPSKELKIQGRNLTND
jgi:hypothetical protein